MVGVYNFYYSHPILSNNNRFRVHSLKKKTHLYEFENIGILLKKFHKKKNIHLFIISLKYTPANKINKMKKKNCFTLQLIKFSILDKNNQKIIFAEENVTLTKYFCQISLWRNFP